MLSPSANRHSFSMTKLNIEWVKALSIPPVFLVKNSATVELLTELQSRREKPKTPYL